MAVCKNGSIGHNMAKVCLGGGLSEIVASPNLRMTKHFFVKDHVLMIAPVWRKNFFPIWKIPHHFYFRWAKQKCDCESERLLRRLGLTEAQGQPHGTREFKCHGRPGTDYNASLPRPAMRDSMPATSVHTRPRSRPVTQQQQPPPQMLQIVSSPFRRKENWMF